MHNTHHSKETCVKISIGNLKTHALHYANSWNKISLRSKHMRISKKYGKPKYCEICKRTDKKRYEWANKDHKYSLEIKYWMRVCNKCHMEYDRKNNNYKGFWWNTKEKIHPTKSLTINNK